MGLFSKKSKAKAEDPLQPTSTVYQAPEMTPTTTADSSAPEAKAAPAYAQPGEGAAQFRWGEMPHTTEYKTQASEADKKAKREAKAEKKERKKSWFAQKFDLVGPDDKEEYKDRKEGSDWDKAEKKANKGPNLGRLFNV